MKQKEDEKLVVFAVINMAEPKEQRKKLVQYASAFSKHVNMQLMLHPRHEGSGRPFKSAYKSVYAMARKMEISYVMSKEVPNFFESIGDVAARSNAAFLLMNIGDERKKGIRKLFGQNAWDVVKKTSIPVLLIPRGAEFDGFSEVTVAVDSERKIQKMNFFRYITTKHTSVNIFVENPENQIKQSVIDNTLSHISLFLSRQDIPFEQTIARNKSDYSQHLLRFAAKRSKLLLIEVDEGGVASNLKNNLQKILFSEHQHFAVMLVKTKTVTISRWQW